jgi:hypothetical protein
VVLIARIGQMPPSFTAQLTNQLKEVRIYLQLARSVQWFSKLRMPFTLWAGITRRKTYTNLTLLEDTGKLMKTLLFDLLIKIGKRIYFLKAMGFWGFGVLGF